MKKFNLLFFVFLSLFTSCKKDEDNAVNNESIVGEWDWISTDGGIAFHIHETPATTGKNIILKLFPDYSYSISENNNIVAEGTYNLTLEESIYSGTMELFISPVVNYKNQFIVISGIVNRINETDLTISDNFYDGIGSGFKKIQ